MNQTPFTDDIEGMTLTVRLSARKSQDNPGYSDQFASREDLEERIALFLADAAISAPCRLYKWGYVEVFDKDGILRAAQGFEPMVESPKT
jgi:hypothetical protein